MTVDFRTAIFHLCKEICQNSKAIEIRELIQQISSSNSSSEDSSKTVPKPLHGDLAYISSRYHIQFLGYLLTDESVDSINKRPFFHATHLDKKERSLIEMGHMTIIFFIESCIKDIKEKYPKASLLVNPYLKYIEPKLSSDAVSFLKNDDVAECVEAFKASKIYKKVMENDALYVLQQASDDKIKAMGILLDKQLTNDFSKISEETTEMIRCIDSGNISMQELLITYSIFCYALQKTLENAIQMLFEAIMGKDLVVLNNDNIIKLYDNQMNQLYERCSVLCQDLFLDHGITLVGSIVLLSCTTQNNKQIKKFGRVFSETISLDEEFGPSTKISIVTVDEELNPVHPLSDHIIDSSIGKLKVIHMQNPPD